MNPRQRALLVVAGCALVFGALVWWSGHGRGNRLQSVVSPMLAMRADAKSLAWRPDDRFAYSLNVDALVTVDPNQATPEVLKSNLQALLCARVLETGDGTARVAIQLRNVLHETGGVRDAQRQAALGVPFVVLFNGGMPSTIEFPPGLDPEVRSELSGLVHTFQVTLPDSPSVEWSALESDEGGRYRAAYQVDPKGAWNKRKVAYVQDISGAGSGGEPARVFDSAATLWPATGGSWWKRAEVTDDVQISIGSALPVRAKHHSVLEALPGGFDPTSDVARDWDARDLLRLPVPAYARKNLVAPGLASPEDRERFLGLLSSYTADGGENFADVHRLAKMLEAFPELAEEIPARLMDADLAELVGAGLIHALELAGNETCQNALQEVFSGPDYPHSNRVRAIIGLGGVENPTPASIDALWQVSEYPGGKEAKDLANTALLALGNLGNDLRVSGNQRYAELSVGLQSGLAAAAPESKAVLLTAISNTRDPALLAAVVPELEAREPVVRAAAVRALSSMDGPEALDSLSARVAHEENSWVRAALVDGMGRLSYKSDSAFLACASLLSSEKDTRVRAALARYLGENLEDYPAGRDTLEGLLHDRSNSAEIRAYVAKALRSQSTPRSASAP